MSSESPAFLSLALIWAVSSGVYAGWMTLLDVYLEADLTAVEIGWVGFGGNLAGAVGGVAAGLVIDRLGTDLKGAMVSLYLGATVSAGGFLLAVYIMRSLAFPPIFASVTLVRAPAVRRFDVRIRCAEIDSLDSFEPVDKHEMRYAPGAAQCGLFANAAAPITLELASELTFPAGEETSATLLVVLFSAIQAGFILGGSFIEPAAMNWINVGTLGIATLLLLGLPSTMARKAIDTKAAETVREPARLV